ncbi:MAG: winged helix DNA-binding protein [Azospirillaceae bacterium]
MESYHELTRLLERLHRRHLDVVRIDLAAEGIEDVTPAQAMLLMDIGEAEISIRDLIERGYYLASTATYNIRKLAELGYVDQTRSPSDRRQVRLKLTDRGLDLVARVRAGHPQVANAEGEESDAWRERLAEAARTLRELERAWFDYVSFK